MAYFGPVFNSLYSYDGRKLPSDFELLREYATNDIVYACVNYNANAVAQVPFRLYTAGSSRKAIRSHPSRRASRITKARLRKNPNLVKMIGPGDDVTEITEHPILDLIYGENGGLNGFDFAFLTQIYKEILGRAYWELENASISGAPSSLYMLKPQRVMPVRSMDGRGSVIEYRNQPDLRGGWEPLEVEDVVDYRFPHPEDPYGWGMSPLKACYAQAELTSKFTKFGNDLMDNRARIDGMFIPADDMGAEMARKAEDQFAQRFGNNRAGGVWFSPTKGTFVPTRYAPTDLGPMEVDKNTTSRLCRAFSIPEPLMSANESTFSNMDKALQFHAKFATTPRILQNEQRMNERICPLFDDRLFLAADNPIPEDNEFELKKVQVAMSGKVLTPNETREALGFEEMAGEGMDDLPATDEELQQQQLDAKAAQQTPDDKSEEDDTPAPVEKAVFDTARLIDINKAVTAGDMPRGAAITAVVKAFGVTSEEARELVGYAKGEAEIVAETPAAPVVAPPPAETPVIKATAIDEALDALVDSRARLTPEERKRRKQFLLLLLAFFGWQAHELASGTGRADEARFNARLTDVLSRGMRDALRSAGDVSEPVATQGDAEIARIAADVAEKINGTTAKAITDATAGGETSIVEAVDAALLRAIETRAETIEGDMYHLGKQVRNKVQAILTGKQVVWRTKEDDRVCDDQKLPDGTIKYGCSPLNGVVMKAGEEFAPGIRWPVTDTHANCRCELEEVPDDDTPKTGDAG